MASRGFNLTAEINLRGPSNIRQVVSGIRRQLGTINANVNVNINPATSKNISRINRQFTTLNTTLSATTQQVTSTTQAFNDLTTAVRALSNAGSAIPNFQGVSNQVTASMSKASSVIKETRTEMEEFGRLGGLAIRRFAAFSAATSVIYGFTNAVTDGIKQFIEFDRQITRLSQVTNQSKESLGDVTGAITRLSTGLGVASADLANVSVTLAQAGFSARDTRIALEALAKSVLAPSFDDLNSTVEGSIALMRQFDISAKDLEKTLGSINSVAAAFAVEAGDIITAIQRTGGVFASASKGVSEGTDALNEFISIFTSVRATTRESAETIATGLRTIFTRIQRSSTIEALKEYGVELTDLEGKFVGPYEAVRRLSEGLNLIDPRDLKFSEIVEELGGFRQIGKVLPLIQQFSVAQEALKVAQKGQGSLAADAATGQLALAVQIQKVREEFTALIRSFGDSGSFKTLVSLGLDLASAFIKIANVAKDLAPLLGVILATRGLSAATQFVGGFGAGLRGGNARKVNMGGLIDSPAYRFASGGVVPGSGRGDKVPALLEPGEVVMSNRAVSKYGRGNLVRMNKYPINNRPQRFAFGSSRGVSSSTKNKQPVVIDTYDTDTQASHVGRAFGSLSPEEVDTYASMSVGRGKRSAKFDPTLTREKGLTYSETFKLDLPRVANQNMKTGSPGVTAASLAGWIKLNSSKLFSSRRSIPRSGLIGTEEEFAISLSEALLSLNQEIVRDPELSQAFEKVRSRLSPSYIKSKEGKVDLFSALAFRQIRHEGFDINKIRKQQRSGGLIQAFQIGGIAKRNIGYIDYDVIANPANEAVVTKGMESVGVKGPRLYADYLTQLAVKARKESSLQKLRAVYGVAGSGKTTLARGQGTDKGKLRETTRFPILTPEDIQKANEVLILSSTVSKDKLDSFFGEVDRAYTLSSTTAAEKERIKAQRTSRDITGVGLEGRTPGGTTGVGKDTAVGEALLQDRLGSRSVVLGRSDSGKLRRKRGDELVNIVKKKIGFTWGGFAPMTAGHESIVDAASAMGIPPEDFIFLVGANESIKLGDASSYRTAIFNQDARVLLAKAGAGARGATVLPKARDFEVPLGFDVSQGTGRRQVVLPSKGSQVFVGDKAEELTGKYKEAGYGVVGSERTGGISGTMVRDLIEKGDLAQLQKVLSPGVYDLISNNIGRIQNRAKILPDIIAQVQKNQAVKLADVEKAIKAVGISRIDKKKLGDPEYAAKIQILEELRSQRDKIKSSAALEPYKLLDELARSQPDKYGLDFSTGITPTAKPIRTVGATQRASIGGLIQRFMAGGEAEETAPWGDTATVPEILRLLTFGGAAKIGRVENPRELLKKKKPTEDEKAKIKAIRDEATKKYNRRIGAAKGVQTRLAGQGLKFAAVGMFGDTFPDETYDAQGTKGIRKVLITAAIMDKALAEQLDADFGGGIESIAQQAAEKTMVGNITKGVLGGKQLELDFDRTLAVGADDIASLTDFRDPTIVQEKLKGATLTRLGRSLVDLVKAHPELTSNMRVVTARSQSTVPLIQQWLADKGLALSDSQFVGVGGDAQIVSESDIPALKAAQLRTGSLFVDDSAANISAAEASNKGIETYQYGAQSTVPNPVLEAGVKGVFFEKMIQNLGGPGRVAGLGFDYPKGLGAAAKYFGIDPDIPTDAKRTIVGAGTIKDNVRTYLKAMGYAGGGKADDQGFEEVRKQIMDKYPEIDFRISKRKKGRGFGYNLLGALKTDGGLLGSKGLQFEQPSNLQKLIEVSDKMATSLINPQELAVGGLADATSEMTSLMGGLYGNRKSSEAAPAKKQKDFGRIGLNEDGDMITASYYKNDKRSGYVYAYKTKDNLYNVGLSKATSGYGPRLYDVVMEAVSEKGAMLTSDRNMVSAEAQKVWQYYFKNRGDVKKTPLDPEDWTKNQSLIDPKLYGRRETWPPSTDPAWVLQSGYSKSPSLINDPNSVVRGKKKPTKSSGQMALEYFGRANGGRLGFATGGSVPALVSNGEAYVPPKLAKKIGYGTLNRMNQADRNGMGRFSSGGISVFKGPGSGTSDSIPTSLPVGSFIIREKATKALGLKTGGQIKRAFGGKTRDIGALDLNDPAGLTQAQQLIGATTILKGALGDLAKELEALGATSSASAKLLKRGSSITIAQSLEAMRVDLQMAQVSGASASKLMELTAAINKVEQASTAELKAIQMIQNSDGGILGNIQATAMQMAENQASQQRTALASAGASSSQIEKLLSEGGEYTGSAAGAAPIQVQAADERLRQAYEVSATGTNLEGADGDAIRQAINSLSRDLKNLDQIEQGFIRARKAHFITQGRSNDEAERLAQEESNVRRQAVESLDEQRKKDQKARDRNVGAGLAFATISVGSIIANSIDVKGSATAAGAAAAIQSATSTAGTGYGLSNELSRLGDMAEEAGGWFAKLGGPLARFGSSLTLGATAALTVINAFNAAKNAVQEFYINLEKNRLDVSFNNFETEMERLTKDINNMDFTKVDRILTNSGQNFSNTLDMMSSKITYTLNGLIDYLRTFLPEAFGGITQDAFTRISQIREFGGEEAALRATISEDAELLEYRNIAPILAQQQAAIGKPLADAVMTSIRERLRKGQTEQDVFNSGNFESFARTLANANAAVREEIIKLENSGLDAAIIAERRQEMIESYAREKIQLEAIASGRERDAKALSKLGNVYTGSLSRMFENMNQAVASTSAALKRLTDASDLTAKALSGQAEAGNINLEILDILQNPRGYSSTQQQQAQGAAAQLFGTSSDLVSGLLRGNEETQATILRTINETLRADPTANNEVIARRIDTNLNKAFKDLGLPPEIADKLAREVGLQIAEIRKDGEEFTDFASLSEKVGSLGRVVNTFETAQNGAIKALQGYQEVLNLYTTNNNKLIELTISQRQKERQATNLLVDSFTALDRALGKNINLEESRSRLAGKVKDFTGSDDLDPGAIFNTIIRQNTVRDIAQSNARAAGERGLAGADDFIKFNNELSASSIALRENYSALKLLAENTDLASDAMSKIQDAQQKISGRVSFVEKVVTATPDELDSLNSAVMRLQRNINGQFNTIQNSVGAQKAYNEAIQNGAGIFQAMRAAQTAFANERKETLGALNDLLPFLGSGREAGNIRANVLESMLRESGMGVSPIFAQVLNSLRNPETDPETAAAMEFYNEAINLQAQANKYLAKLDGELANDIANKQAAALVEGLKGVLFKFESTQLKDLNESINRLIPVPAAPKSEGGIIYASAGQMINFEPKGTDTVPAMLTPGEFVVNRAATQRNLPLLQSINSNKYNKGGSVRYLATGGYVHSFIKNEKLITEADQVGEEEVYDFSNVGTFNTFREKQDRYYNIPSIYTVHSTRKQTPTKDDETGNIDFRHLKPDNINQVGIGWSTGFYQQDASSSNEIRIVPTARWFKEFSNPITAIDPNKEIFLPEKNTITTAKIYKTQYSDWANQAKRIISNDQMVPFLVKDISEPTTDGFLFEKAAMNHTKDVPGKIAGLSKGPIPTTRTENAYRHYYANTTTGPKLDVVSDESPLFVDPLSPYFGKPFKETTGYRTELFEPDSKDLVGDNYKKYLESMPESIEIYKKTKEFLNAPQFVSGPMLPDVEKLMKILEDAYSETQSYVHINEPGLINYFDGLNEIAPGITPNSLMIFKPSDAALKELVTSYKQIPDSRKNKFVGWTNAPNDLFDDTFMSRENITIQGWGDKIGQAPKSFPWVMNADLADLSEDVKQQLIEGVEATNPGDITMTRKTQNRKINLAWLDNVVPGLGNKPINIDYAYDEWKGKLYDPVKKEHEDNSTSLLLPAGVDNTIFDTKNIPPDNKFRYIADPNDIAAGKIVRNNNNVIQTDFNSYLAAILNKDEDEQAKLQDKIKDAVLYNFTNRKFAAINYGKIPGLNIDDVDTDKPISITEYIVDKVKEMAKLLGKDADKIDDPNKFKTLSLDDNSIPEVLRNLSRASLQMFGRRKLPGVGSNWLASYIGKVPFMKNMNVNFAKQLSQNIGGVFNQAGSFVDSMANSGRFIPRVTDYLKEYNLLLRGASAAFFGLGSGNTSLIAQLMTIGSTVDTLFRTLGGGSVMSGIASLSLNQDWQNLLTKSLEGGTINSVGAGGTLAPVDMLKKVPTDVKSLQDLIFNPYNEFPQTETRSELMSKFISDLENFRGVNARIGNVGRQQDFYLDRNTLQFAKDRISILQEWYGGSADMGWLGQDYLNAQDPNPADRASDFFDSYAKFGPAIRNKANPAHIELGYGTKYGPLPTENYFLARSAKRFQTGGVVYADNGGYMVDYQPRGTDTVPAMLTPGEFVVNRAAAQANLPLLQSINSGNYATGGIVYAATGRNILGKPKSREIPIGEPEGPIIPPSKPDEGKIPRPPTKPRAAGTGSATEAGQTGGKSGPTSRPSTKPRQNKPPLTQGGSGGSNFIRTPITTPRIKPRTKQYGGIIYAEDGVLTPARLPAVSGTSFTRSSVSRETFDLMRQQQEERRARDRGVTIGLGAEQDTTVSDGLLTQRSKLIDALANNPDDPNTEVLLTNWNQRIATTTKILEDRLNAQKGEASSTLDHLSDALAVAGFIPVIGNVADLVSIPVDLLRGDIVGAGLSALAVIPGFGATANVAKGARKVAKGAEAISSLKKADALLATAKFVASSPIKEKSSMDIEGGGILARIPTDFNEFLAPRNIASVKFQQGGKVKYLADGTEGLVAQLRTKTGPSRYAIARDLKDLYDNLVTGAFQGINTLDPSRVTYDQFTQHMNNTGMFREFTNLDDLKNGTAISALKGGGPLSNKDIEDFINTTPQTLTYRRAVAAAAAAAAKPTKPDANKKGALRRMGSWTWKYKGRIGTVLGLGTLGYYLWGQRQIKSKTSPEVQRVVSEDEARKHPEGRKVVEQTDRGIASVQDQKRRTEEAQQEHRERQRREGAGISAGLAAQKWTNQKMSNLKDDRGPRYKIGRENGYAALLQDNNGEMVPDIIDDILTQIEKDDSIKPNDKYNKRRTLFSWYKENKSRNMDALFEYLSQDKYRAYLPEQIKNLLQKDGKSDQQWRANAADLENALKGSSYLSSGGIVYANNGMLIPYQPRGTDTVPAMLTPGEFVVNRAATQANLPLLKAINSSTGGSISGYADGGVIYAKDGGIAGLKQVLVKTQDMLIPPVSEMKKIEAKYWTVTPDQKHFLIDPYSKQFKALKNNIATLYAGFSEYSNKYADIKIGDLQQLGFLDENINFVLDQQTIKKIFRQSAVSIDSVDIPVKARPNVNTPIIMGSDQEQALFDMMIQSGMTQERALMLAKNFDKITNEELSSISNNELAKAQIELGNSIGSELGIDAKEIKLTKNVAHPEFLNNAQRLLDRYIDKTRKDKIRDIAIKEGISNPDDKWIESVINAQDANIRRKLWKQGLYKNKEDNEDSKEVWNTTFTSIRPRQPTKQEQEQDKRTAQFERDIGELTGGDAAKAELDRLRGTPRRGQTFPKNKDGTTAGPATAPWMEQRDSEGRRPGHPLYGIPPADSKVREPQTKPVRPVDTTRETDSSLPPRAPSDSDPSMTPEQKRERRRQLEEERAARQKQKLGSDNVGENPLAGLPNKSGDEDAPSKAPRVVTPNNRGEPLWDKPRTDQVLPDGIPGGEDVTAHARARGMSPEDIARGKAALAKMTQEARKAAGMAGRRPFDDTTDLLKDIDLDFYNNWVRIPLENRSKHLSEILRQQSKDSGIEDALRLSLITNGHSDQAINEAISNLLERKQRVLEKEWNSPRMVILGSRMQDWEKEYERERLKAGNRIREEEEADRRYAEIETSISTNQADMMNRPIEEKFQKQKIDIAKILGYVPDNFGKLGSFGNNGLIREAILAKQRLIDDGLNVQGLGPNFERFNDAAPTAFETSSELEQLKDLNERNNALSEKWARENFGNLVDEQTQILGDDGKVSEEKLRSFLDSRNIPSKDFFIGNLIEKYPKDKDKPLLRWTRGSGSGANQLGVVRNSDDKLLLHAQRLYWTRHEYLKEPEVAAAIDKILKKPTAKADATGYIAESQMVTEAYKKYRLGTAFWRLEETNPEDAEKYRMFSPQERIRSRQRQKEIDQYRKENRFEDLPKYPRFAEWVESQKEAIELAKKAESIPVQNRASGGLIYASEGTLVNYQSRGTDTVPAMLTPGEFVVNRAATQRNLPLLQAINSSNGGSVNKYGEGGVVYLAAGGTVEFNPGVQVEMSRQEAETQARRARGAAAKQQREQEREARKQAGEQKQVDRLAVWAKSVIENDRLSTLDSLDKYKVRALLKEDPDVFRDSILGIKSMTLSTATALVDETMGDVNGMVLKNIESLPSPVIEKLLEARNSGVTKIFLPKYKDTAAQVRTQLNKPVGFDLEPLVFSDIDSFDIRTDPDDPSRPFQENASPEGLWRNLLEEPSHTNPSTKNLLAYIAAQEDQRDRELVGPTFEKFSGTIKKNAIEPEALQDILNFVKSRNGNVRFGPDANEGFVEIDPKLAEVIASYSDLMESFYLERLGSQQHTVASTLIGSKLKKLVLAIERIPSSAERTMMNLDDMATILAQFKGTLSLPELKTITKYQLQKFIDSGTNLKPDLTKVVPVAPPPVNRQHGGIIYASEGTLVNYQPRGTDTVPAMLTPGEFVVNRAATQRNLPLLKAINSGNYATGGIVYLAQGGVRPRAVVPQTEPLDAPAGNFDFDKALEQAAPNDRRQKRAEAYNEQKNKAKAAYERRKKMQTLPPIGRLLVSELNTMPNNFDLLNTSAINEALDGGTIKQKIEERLEALDDEKRQAYFISTARNYLNRYRLLLGWYANSKKAIAAMPNQLNKPLSDYMETTNAGTLGDLLNTQVTNAPLEGMTIYNTLREMIRNNRALPGFETENISPEALDRQIGLGSNPVMLLNKGGVVYAKKGMMVDYRPKGTDTIPAMLTPGEFVVNKESAQDNLSLLSAINSGNYAAGGSVKYLSNGTAGGIGFDSIFTTFSSGLKASLTTINAAISEFLGTIQNDNQGVNNNGGSINLDAIGQFTAVFARFVDQLQKINIPPQINVTLTQQEPIRVQITGAEALQQLLNGPLGQMISSSIKQALNREAINNESPTT